MKDKYAILIDGGFVKSKMGSKNSPIDAIKIKSLTDRIREHKLLADKQLYRIYYYDAPPFSKSIKKTLKGEPCDFSKEPLTKHNIKLLKNLKKLDYFALRMGETLFRGWELNMKTLPSNERDLSIDASNLRPAIRQKGVDMRIGLDIASLTLKKQINMLVLITGDSDFVPAMKFARREGVQFAVVTLGHKGIIENLLEHADFHLAEIESKSI